MNNAIKETRRDLVMGLQRWELWTLLGWNQIRQKYRRSLVGPMWASLNFLVFVGVLGFLYAELMGQDLNIYLPHLILGLLVWNFLSQVVLEGCHLFKSMQPFMQEVNIPLTTFVFVLIWRNIILFAFSFVAFILAALVLPIVPNTSWLLAVVGLMLILVNALWMGMFIAVVAARYHDLIEIVGSLFRILFFITPIIWLPGMAGRFNSILDFNPFYHLIEVFRACMLGGRPSIVSWVVTIVIAVCGWLVTSAIYVKYKNRIVFWV